MTIQIDPYTVPVSGSGFQPNRFNMLLTVLDLVIYSAGSIAASYCLLMLFWPELAEDLAVSLTSKLTGNAPRSGDYRFAWSAVYYSIPVALVFLMRLGVAAVIAVHRYLTMVR